MQYRHISKEERRIIEKLTQAGTSNRNPRVKSVVLFASHQIDFSMVLEHFLKRFWIFFGNVHG